MRMGKKAERAGAKGSKKRDLGNTKKGGVRIALGAILLVCGLALLVTLAYPKIYAAVSPAPAINKIILEQGHFWVVIPKIRVDSPVLPTVTADSLRRGVAHVPESGFPGEGKNVIIVGHNYDPANWVPQTTFGLLSELEDGDEVLVAYRGRAYTYVVKTKETLGEDDPELYELTDDERLTLLTCENYESKTKRLKVVAMPK
ncbi:MAG TPA: hypothetical protein DE036_00785 [Actinobacteria bacterium]|nr:hypothetical protein [Actinomycetota bacterium]